VSGMTQHHQIDFVNDLCSKNLKISPPLVRGLVVGILPVAYNRRR
jgi:hypothetical protein